MRFIKIVSVIVLIVLALALGALGARWYLEQNADVSQTAAQYDATAKEGRGSRVQTTERVIQNLQRALEKNPHNAQQWAWLGAAFLQRARENGDPANYTRAEQAFTKALALDAKNLTAISGMGGLKLAQHQFAEAVDWGERGVKINPDNAGLYGILGDAHLELGEYDTAFENFQTMVDTRPDLSSYARVSYARELLGDRADAIETMGRAVEAGAANSEAKSWALVQLGNLYFDEGNLERAHDAYQAALQNWNDYPYARGGLAKVYAAQGDYAQAIQTYTRLIETIPLPEYVIALGDVYAANGDLENARKQYELVGAMQQLFNANGVDTDAELALFNADHQIDLPNTLELAKRAYAKRPGILVGDTLAWTYYQTGDYQNARALMEQALKLDTQNALFYFHAGMIYAKLEDAPRAIEYLDKALQLNPHFSLRYAKLAQTQLAELRSGVQANP